MFIKSILLFLIFSLPLQAQWQVKVDSLKKVDYKTVLIKYQILNNNEIVFDGLSYAFNPIAKSLISVKAALMKRGKKAKDLTELVTAWQSFNNTVLTDNETGYKGLVNSIASDSEKVVISWSIYNFENQLLYGNKKLTFTDTQITKSQVKAFILDLIKQEKITDDFIVNYKNMEGVKINVE